MFDSIFIFVPEAGQIIKISEGSGDNLLQEDMDEGYVDYIYYEQYGLEADLREVDGGMVLMTELFREKFTSTEDAIPHVLDMAYGSDSFKYIVLKGDN
jgi:hypothetical protein